MSREERSAHPTASAGATLCAVRLSGKLKGETMLMTPMGKLRTMAAMPLVRFEMSIGAYSPAWHVGWSSVYVMISQGRRALYVALCWQSGLMCRGLMAR